MAKKLNVATPARGAKGQAVRRYLKQNPDAPVKAVVEALKAQGLQVSVPLVGSIKYGKKTQMKISTSNAAPTAIATNNLGALSTNDLLEAKALSDKLGGLTQMRRALDVLEKLSQLG